jgi:sugar phosphate isomerase/epimerase
VADDVNLSVQLFSVRDHLGDDLESTLGKLKEIGYSHIEPYDILTATSALKSAMDRSGLQAVAAHAKITELDKDRVIAAAKELGIGTIIVPWVDSRRMLERGGVEQVAGEINEASRYARRHGIRVGYHNHEFEFAQLIDGRPAYELLVDSLDDDVVLQVDTFWASVGGADVLELLPRHRDRVRFLHVKAGPPDPDEPPLLGGDGTLHMEEIFELTAGVLEMSVVELVVHGDPFPLLRTNCDYFRGVLSS